MYVVEVSECPLGTVIFPLLPHLKYYCDGVEVGVWRCDAVMGVCGDDRVSVDGASNESAHVCVLL